MKLGNGREIGRGHPAYVIAEIGINHNGDLGLALALVDVAADAGCDAVKIQKRTPRLCVSADQAASRRSTPWGEMSYLEYRERVELSPDDCRALVARCAERGIAWLASCWDIPSVEFVASLEPTVFKIASACLTDEALLREHRKHGLPIILSTGMSTLEEIDRAVEILGTQELALLHCTSTYPAKPGELNLNAMATLRERYGVPVGYSGHEVGLATTVAAATLGACIVERHITLDRASWGSDQAASLEPPGLARLVRDIRVIREAMGDGVKRVYDSEIPIRAKLRIS